MDITRKILKLQIMDQEIKKFFFQLLNLKIKGLKILIDGIEVPKLQKFLKKP